MLECFVVDKLVLEPLELDRVDVDVPVGCFVLFFLLLVVQEVLACDAGFEHFQLLLFIVPCLVELFFATLLA